MSEGATRSIISVRRIIVQAAAFLVGIGLLWWCISLALGGDEDRWRRVFSADWRLLAGLIGFSVISLLVNGFTFWVVIRPVRPLRLYDLTVLNFVTALLNYAPIRAGLIARLAYHFRVDRMPARQIAVWLLAMTVYLGISLGACVVATIIRPSFDLGWIAIAGGLLVTGGAIIPIVASWRFVTALDADLVTMLVTPWARWSVLAVRLIDIGAFVGRMACAAAILDLSFGVGDTMLLGFAALVMSLNPLTRVGFREITVAFVATRLQSGLGPLDDQMAALAVVESAGEALAALPLGVLGVIWFRQRWRGAVS